ncbi:hypothetical protein P8864_14365 [Priestia flexa]|uniref:hypothetical protein n=1 Tax=Priestia flexa TaxID=86664 RepID=UPI000C2463AD|nr:hypothetical protein [Priestia flexa]MEC0667059.1 hypothetical protein [Priestia flexa]
MYKDKNRYRAGVSFSATDPYESQLALHAMKQGKFSNYIKRLIDRDMQGTPVKRHSEPMSVNNRNIGSVI